MEKNRQADWLAWSLQYLLGLLLCDTDSIRPGVASFMLRSRLFPPIRLLWLLLSLGAVGATNSSASDSTEDAHISILKHGSTQAPEFVRKYLLITGTDRGGDLTVVSSPAGSIQSIRVEVGLSNSDLIKEFSFDDNHLVEVRETRRTYSYNEKTGTIDFTKVRLTTTTLYRVTRRSPQIRPAHKEEPIPKDIQMLLVEESDFLLRLLKEQPDSAELDIEQHLKQGL